MQLWRAGRERSSSPHRSKTSTVPTHCRVLEPRSRTVNLDNDESLLLVMEFAAAFVLRWYSRYQIAAMVWRASGGDWAHGARPLARLSHIYRRGSLCTCAAPRVQPVYICLRVPRATVSIIRMFRYTPFQRSPRKTGRTRSGPRRSGPVASGLRYSYVRPVSYCNRIISKIKNK